MSTTADPVPAESASTRRIELFEPAMCCESGVCGPSVDQQLLDVREDLRWTEEHGAEVARHNLTSDAAAFVANPKVTGLMTAFGDSALPALVVDGEIVLHGRYPSRADLSKVLEAAPRAEKESPKQSGGCGCGPSGCC